MIKKLYILLVIACAAQPAYAQNSTKIIYSNTTRIARVTGNALDGETFSNTNNTPRDYDVGGTDLGIIWEMDKGKYGIFFGDTYGADFVYDHAKNDPTGSNWRCNVLAFSDDSDLEDGLTINSMLTDTAGRAREIIYGAKDKSNNGDWTSIPTAAIRANGTDYVHYMNVRSWTSPKGWITNYSGLYKSKDNGKTWDKCEGIGWNSSSNFGQAGYYKKDGFVYIIGTQTGRASCPKLARFREKDIETLAEYEYWNGEEKKWIKGDESRADDLFEDTVGELSLIYNTKFKKWIISYFCSKRYNITVRDADDITGPWSKPVEIVSGKDYPRLYGSYIHPLSANSDKLYFLMSKWVPYNVFLMKTEMKISD